MPLTKELVIEGKNYLPMVRAIAKSEWERARRLISYDEAESAVLLGLSKCLSEYDPARGKFSSYASYRMRYSVRDVVDSERRRLRVVSYQDVETDCNDFRTDGLELRTKRREIVQQILALMERCLSSRQRYVIARYYLDEATVGEIAEELDISATTIAAWKRRGLSELRRQMVWRNCGMGQLPWSSED